MLVIWAKVLWDSSTGLLMDFCCFTKHSEVFSHLSFNSEHLVQNRTRGKRRKWQIFCIQSDLITTATPKRWWLAQAPKGYQLQKYRVLKVKKETLIGFAVILQNSTFFNVKFSEKF